MFKLYLIILKHILFAAQRAAAKADQRLTKIDDKVDASLVEERTVVKRIHEQYAELRAELDSETALTQAAYKQAQTLANQLGSIIK